ncbi:hypothetical protein SAMN05444164_3883 [Bradyrhizobium erythrophlei]|uniref:Uncharacterized protein n=1 Tax=Bradyrhizobium erythrophlei TaxID=1437360 RepID=A0A1H4YEG3_9BRAD|nr:hypothetical protein SAMN05444164_3883 [Bradyrhizobium erythrophlei]
MYSFIRYLESCGRGSLRLATVGEARRISLARDQPEARWAAGGADDLEEDNNSGRGDWDGLLEQVGTQDWQQGAMA